MKDLVTYLTESEKQEFKQFVRELIDADNLTKYFDGANEAKASGASQSTASITVYAKKGRKIDVTEALKNMAQKSKNFEACLSEVMYYVFVYPLGDEEKYDIYIELKSVVEDNFDYMKRWAGRNEGKVLIEPSKL